MEVSTRTPPIDAARKGTERMLDLIISQLYAHSHLGVFIALLIIGFGLPVPEDIILITGGVISAKDDSVVLMVLVGMAGVLVGDSIIFTLGYHYGEAILNRRPFIWLVTPERLAKVRAYYRKYGYWTIFFSRFAAGLRATSFLLAGTSHVPYRIFILANGAAALFSVPFFVLLGYYFADNIAAGMAMLKEVQAGVLITVGVLLVAWLLRKYVWKRQDSTPPHDPPATPPTEPETSERTVNT